MWFSASQVSDFEDPCHPPWLLFYLLWFRILLTLPRIVSTSSSSCLSLPRCWSDTCWPPCSPDLELSFSLHPGSLEVSVLHTIFAECLMCGRDEAAHGTRRQIYPGCLWMHFFLIKPQLAKGKRSRGSKEVIWNHHPLQLLYPIWSLLLRSRLGTQTWKPMPDDQLSPRSQLLMLFGKLRPLWAKGLVPSIIVIYTPYPFGCKMVLIRCIPCLLSLAQGRLKAWLLCCKREGDLHGSLQDSVNLSGIYWPSIRTVKYCLHGP